MCMHNINFGIWNETSNSHWAMRPLFFSFCLAQQSQSEVNVVFSYGGVKTEKCLNCFFSHMSGILARQESKYNCASIWQFKENKIQGIPLDKIAVKSK